MVKLLIVDDENIIRSGLKTMIEDLELPSLAIYEAENGYDALEAVESCKPEIILVDIRMPKMDGIELIKRLRQSGCEARIIILTGFNEFEYAREAIQNRVMEYLLKPVQRKELEKALKNAIWEWQEERGRKNKEILYSLEDEKLNLSDLFKSMDITLQHPYFIVFYGETANNSSRENTSDSDWQISLKEYFSSCGIKSIVLPDTKGSLICVANLEEEPDCKFVEKLLNATFHIPQLEKHKLTWGVSKTGKSLDGIPKLLHQAQAAARERILGGTGRIYLMEELLARNVNAACVSGDITGIITKLELEDYGKLEQFIDVRFNEWIYKYGISMKNLENLLCKYCMEMIAHFESSEEKNAPFMGYMEDFSHSLLKCSGIQEIKSLFIRTLDRILTNDGRKEKQSGVRKTLLIAQQYIKQNFNKDINLDMVANHVSMNPTYFSVLFKKEAGVSLVQYILDVRINKALEYLRDPQVRVYEVAGKVGFNDDKYFFRVFKKKIGVTPSEYRGKSS